MIAAPQDISVISQIPEKVRQIHNAFQGLSEIEEKYKIDESASYELIVAEMQGYQSALRGNSEPISSARRQRLEILCQRYIEDFSQHVKG